MPTSLRSPATPTFLIDSDMDFRKLLRRKLTANAEIEIVGSADSIANAIDAVRQSNPRVVIVEAEISIEKTILAIEKLTALGLDLEPVVCLPASAPKETRETLIKRGIRHLWDKRTDWGSENSSAEDSSLQSLKLLVKRAGQGTSKQPLVRSTNLQAKDPATSNYRLPTTPSSTADNSTLRPPLSGTNSASFTNKLPPRTSRPAIIAIGSSTGGPEALTKLFSLLHPNFDIPILVVQHIPTDFAPRLAARLSNVTGHQIQVASHEMPITRSIKVIAPGDFHMQLAGPAHRWTLELNQSEKVQSCRPAVDVLFKSVANTAGKNGLGIVLTGMGCDGASGAAVMANSGATIWVQSPESCVVNGMPAAAHALCPKAKVFDIASIAAELNRIRDLKE